MTGLVTAGFTAARELDMAGRVSVLSVLTQLPPVGRYVTGACRGGDAYIGQWLLTHHPGARHAVVVPANRSQIHAWWLTTEGGERVEFIIMPPGTTYKDRNQKIVDESVFVAGFPAYPEGDARSARSGTWQTIRLARDAGKMCRWQCVKHPYDWAQERPAALFLAA